MVDPVIRAAIIRAATEDGIDPSYALAYADRESGFDPRAHASKTIRGLFQMRGDLRNQYGVGDSDDPYVQAKGWGSFLGGVKRDMGRVLGRDVNDQEAYLGHHFGANRAARMMTMDPATPVNTVFTPYELSVNPHIGKAGTVGALNSVTMADIGRRAAKFGGADLPDFSGEGEAASPPDLSSFGQLAEQTTTGSQPQPKGALDLSSYGTPV